MGWKSADTRHYCDHVGNIPPTTPPVVIISLHNETDLWQRAYSFLSAAFYPISTASSVQHRTFKKQLLPVPAGSGRCQLWLLQLCDGGIFGGCHRIVAAAPQFAIMQ